MEFRGLIVARVLFPFMKFHLKVRGGRLAGLSSNPVLVRHGKSGLSYLSIREKSHNSESTFSFKISFTYITPDDAQAQYPLPTAPSTPPL